MDERFSRRGVLAALLAGAAESAFATPPLTSRRPVARADAFAEPAIPAVERLIEKANLGGRIGFVVADARSGEVLEARNPLRELPPASVTKAVTALYALDVLGPDHRFRTQLVATGPVKNGRIEGDLILRGGGDPTLDTDALGDMAAELKDQGIREITGRFRIDASVMPRMRSIDREQPDHVAYNPAICGLNLNYNRVHFEWKPAGKRFETTLQARAVRFRPEVAIASMEIVDRKGPVYTYAAEGHRDIWTVARRALGKGGARWLPVRNPDRYAEEVFRTLARSYGIVLNFDERPAPPGPETVLVEWTSGDLRDIMGGMLHYSNNLIAEVSGLAATGVYRGPVSSLAGSARRMNAWVNERLNARSAGFADHSGLGPASRVSASDMVRALVAAGPDSPLRPILNDVALKDDAGNPFQRGRVSVQAKTGTLNFVSALAGYITTADKRELAFAIFTADVERRDAVPRAERERPPGARGWARRSRALQKELIKRWATVHQA